MRDFIKQELFVGAQVLCITGSIKFTRGIVVRITPQKVKVAAVPSGNRGSQPNEFYVYPYQVVVVNGLLEALAEEAEQNGSE